MNKIHEKYITHVLNLARQGRYGAHPNPMVGALIVKEGRIIGEGYHAQYGGPHAEVEALRQAGAEAKGADLYVTLEPCRHYGKTPPCTKAVLEAGIGRVFIGTRDPFRELSGGGAEVLEQAGLEVQVGILEDECKRLIRTFDKRIRTGKPWVTLKCALSLDGKVGTRTGASRWITSEASRTLVHEKRAEVDGILTGLGTIQADNPQLNVRLKNSSFRSPHRIILDPEGQIDPESKVIQTAKEQLTTLVVSDLLSKESFKPLEDLGMGILPIPCSGQLFSWEDLLSWCGAWPMNEVLIEAGPYLVGSAFDAEIVDSVMFFLAPKIIGGKDAPSAIGGLGIESMEQAPQLIHVSLEPIGPDFLYTADVKY